MSCCNVLTPKDPAERVVVTFDFSAALDAGDALSAILDVTVETTAGVDPLPAAILDGPAAITVSGTSVQQPVSGGVSGVSYGIKVLIETTAGMRLALSAELPVRPA